MHKSFDPECFCHGRALWRFPGSDGARFSPRLAWSMVADAVLAAEGPMGIWDPFCGTAVIGSLARLFFAEQFMHIVASDINPDAVACASQNLDLVSSVDGLVRRRTVVQGHRKRNPKSERRWGAIESYLTSLEPLVERARAEAVQVSCVQGAPTDVVLPEGCSWVAVADTPYGRSSAIEGEGGIDAIILSMVADRPSLGLDLVMPMAVAESLAPRIEAASIRPVKGGRARLRRPCL